MTSEAVKHPNACKHGVFAATAILHGEDPQEFARLHSDLIEEWAPVGATEEDAVLSIAKAVWRKRRLQKFLEVQVTRNLGDANHPSYYETLGLSVFAAALQLKPATAFEDYARDFLRSDRIEYLKKKFPRSSFRSTSEWAAAMINEIRSVLIPESKVEDPQAAVYSELNLSAARVSGDLFKQELALDERLDAMIDRAVKRLIQTKAMKQMLLQTEIERAEDQSKKNGAKAITRERHF
jgi:hypothetical protein